jgi:hypothetical protein
MTLTIALPILLLAASVPYWLPRAVVALRMRIFTRINGDEGIPIPGELVDASHFKQVYSDRAADGRSRGAALSDLFWYWLSPGPEIHQEHIEPGERYQEVAHTTHRILAVPKHTAEDLTRRVVGQIMDEHDIHSATVVRLRDLMMPIWAEVYYEVVFGKPSTPAARKLIVDNASDVVTALKCCSLRHMDRRHRLTRFLIEKVRGGEVPHELPACLSMEEKALYLQGVFFNTAVVQMSEAMTHLMLVIAQHDDVQAKLAADPENDYYLDGVINEGFRIFPLFGISHRITSGDIAVNEQTTIPRGSVLCFNHQEFHRQSFDDPERFDPARWTSLSVHDANFIPFGVAANRSCPAQAIAMITMRVAVRELLRRVRFRSSIRHTRSIPNRGPCLVIPRALDYNARLEGAQLFWMRLRDRWEDVGRSIVQLVLGTYMVWDARRLRLCQRYFETKDSEGDKNPDPKHHASACPFAPRSTARTIPQPSGTRL